MKFPTENGIGDVRGNQQAASQGYNVAMKERPEASSLGPRNREDQ